MLVDVDLDQNYSGTATNLPTAQQEKSEGIIPLTNALN